MIKKLSVDYFQRQDTLEISRNLLGKILVSAIDNQLTSGMIVEVEAYLGAEDRACHAFRRRRTKRTEVMYLPGGHWYVYLCYGVHCLLNVVTHQAEEPHAVLIRAIEPCDGIHYMLQRRRMEKMHYRLTSGPGSVSLAMGIHVQLTGESIGKTVWIEDRGIKIFADSIIASPRIGVNYAQEHAFFPYRFYIKNNPWVSRKLIE